MTETIAHPPAHPMDDIPVRKLAFNFDELAPEAAVWSESSPLFAIFINAFTFHVPYFERYLVRAMSKAKKQIEDPELLQDVKAIIGQEAQHASAFFELNELIKRRYPKAAEIEEEVRHDFKERVNNDTFQSMLGFTAGYETFTFLGGMIVLDNYEKWMADSHPRIKALLVWHQVEEVEHGAVAFEVYQHFFGDDERFRKKMVWRGFRYIVWETLKTYIHMCRVEGWFKNPWRALKAMGFITRVLGRMMWVTRPVMGKNYHPRNHPLATTEQNKIAINWREFYKKGGDVLEIDKARMAEIMGIEPELV